MTANNEKLSKRQREAELFLQKLKNSGAKICSSFPKDDYDEEEDKSYSEDYERFLREQKYA